MYKAITRRNICHLVLILSNDISHHINDIIETILEEKDFGILILIYFIYITDWF